MTGPGAIRVGCSGWSYKDWKGVVYDPARPARTWFEQYAARFDTVELNATFYRLPEPSTVEGWAARAPEGFCYAAKVGQFGTHRMKLRDAASWLPRHLERITRLGDHLGPNLFQLPPRWRRDVARLDEALAATDSRLRWTVEFRDPSWIHDDVFAVLERHGAALCLHDLIEDHPIVRTTDWTYVRFHGPRALTEPYHGRYGARRLTPMVEQLGAWLEDGCDVYVYFNNDWKANAVADAAWMRDELQARKTAQHASAHESERHRGVGLASPRPRHGDRRPGGLPLRLPASRMTDPPSGKTLDDPREGSA